MKKSETNKDVEAIKQAVLDYVEGAYTVDPARIERSVHPKLAKLGFIQEETGYAEHPMTFEELVEIVKTFNQDGHVPQDAPKNITIYEILDQTASAKLEAWWGIDYIHLAKFDEKWKIVSKIFKLYK